MLYFRNSANLCKIKHVFAVNYRVDSLLHKFSFIIFH